MDTATQIIVSGLTLGAMYAISTVSLSLVWGALNVLNMAQGALLAFGAYASYTLVSTLGLPSPLAILFTVALGGALGVLIYIIVVSRMLDRKGFEVNVIIAMVGLGTVLESLAQKIYGAYPIPQPMTVDGGFFLGAVHVPWKSMIIVFTSIVLMLALAVVLNRTRIGRAIRAVSQNRDAARLMGVPARVVYAQVFGLAGALSAVSGIMLSTLVTLSPTMGYDPMLKAFIICVVAGLGNVVGALTAAFALGLFESWVQFQFGVRFGFASMLALVILVLIWRPYGLFGRRKVSRQ